MKIKSGVIIGPPQLLLWPRSVEGEVRQNQLTRPSPVGDTTLSRTHRIWSMCVHVCTCVRVCGGARCQLLWRPPHGHHGLSIMGATNSAHESEGSPHREGTVTVQLGKLMRCNLPKVTSEVICRAGIPLTVSGFLIPRRQAGFGSKSRLRCGLCRGGRFIRLA